MSNLIKAIEYRDLLKEIKELEEEIFGDVLAKKTIQKPEPKKPGPKPKRQKKIDTGKILALKAVGWKEADIARDCDCEVSTVEKVINEDRERQRLADELAKG